jgi:acetate kinase
VEKCRCLGFELSEEKNGKKIKDVVQDIGREGARHKTLICQTDEQVRLSFVFTSTFNANRFTKV